MTIYQKIGFLDRIVVIELLYSIISFLSFAKSTAGEKFFQLSTDRNPLKKYVKTFVILY